jgi:hypothetical protein
MKNSSGSNRYLMSAVIAFGYFPVIEIIFGTIAFWAAKPIRPAQGKKIIPTIIIRFEPG